MVHKSNKADRGAVNIASRIENLGIPGSVLISGDVQKQVKNQEIETISMGVFEMKNVATPMYVYAIKAPSLLIPQKAEKTGAWTLWSFYNEGAPFELREYQAYLLQDWEEAERQISQLKANPPAFQNPGEEKLPANRGFFSIWLEGMLGNIYARQGKQKLALKQLEVLDRLAASFPPKHNPNLRGIIPYYQARIYALLGNKDEAVRYLNQALMEGKAIFAMSFLIDYDLASLRGYEPYEELIRPKE